MSAHTHSLPQCNILTDETVAFPINIGQCHRSFLIIYFITHTTHESSKSWLDKFKHTYYNGINTKLSKLPSLLLIYQNEGFIIF